MVVKIMPNDKGSPAESWRMPKCTSPMASWRGSGCSALRVWDRRTGAGRNVTFPARTYSVNGERRSFSLLRPVSDPNSQDKVRDLVLQAYSDFEAQAAIAS